MIKTSLCVLLGCAVHASFGILVSAQPKKVHALRLLDRYKKDTTPFYERMSYREIECAEKKLSKKLHDILGRRFLDHTKTFFKHVSQEALKDAFVYDRLTFVDLEILVKTFK